MVPSATTILVVVTGLHPFMSDAQDFEAALLALDRARARRILDELASDGSPTEILERLVVPAMESIGRSWEQGDVALSQVYMSGRICQDIVAGSLGPRPDRPASPLRAGQPRLGIGVLDDTHTLGKEIVASVVRAAGYELIDLGSRLTPAQMAGAAIEARLDVVMVSVLMIRSALAVADLVALLRDEGAGVKVVVGGAPFRFDPGLWREVGAHHFGYSASDVLPIVAAVEAAR